MIKDNKLVEKAMNEYYDLKEEVERKKLDLWKLKEELDSIINQEPYMSGRLKSRQHTIYKLEGQIKALERKMNEIKKNAHLKDSMEVLKLSGFQVKDACEKVFTKGEAEDGDIILPQHKCSDELFGLAKESMSQSEIDKSSWRTLSYIINHPNKFTPKTVLMAEKAIKKFEKAFTGDDDATENGSIEEFGKNKEIEKINLEKDPTLAQDEDPDYIKGLERGLSSLKDADPKVAEANAIISLCGGAM